MILLTLLTNTIDHYLHIVGYVALRQGYPGRNNIVKADGLFAIGANEVYVIIVVVSFLAFLAQCITDGVISGRYGMNDAFFLKGLQGTINGHPVVFTTYFFFNIAMGQSITTGQEK